MVRHHLIHDEWTPDVPFLFLDQLAKAMIRTRVELVQEETFCSVSSPLFHFLEVFFR